MKISKRAGALVAGVAMGVSMAVPLALPAGAAKSSVSCTKLTALPLAQTGGKLKSTVSSCTPAALKAGGSSLTTVKKGQTAGTVTNTITWKNGKGTTVAVIKYGSTTKGKCKAPYDSRVKITGSVKSATGAAAKITKKGEPIVAFVCAVTKGAKQGQSALEPGTTFKL